jgi:hypothetical protein
MKLPEFPRETDNPETFLEDIVALRDAALKAGNMDYAVSLSHIHAIVQWAGKVKQAIEG